MVGGDRTYEYPDAESMGEIIWVRHICNEGGMQRESAVADAGWGDIDADDAVKVAGTRPVDAAVGAFDEPGIGQMLPCTVAFDGGGCSFADIAITVTVTGGRVA